MFDLVECADAGVFEDEIRVIVRPHASKFYLLTAERRLERTVYEAETAYLTDYSELDDTSYGSIESCRKQGRAYYGAVTNASGGMAVVNLGGRETNDLIWRDVHVAASGRRSLVFRCASPEPRELFVQIDKGDGHRLTCPATHGGFADILFETMLEKGDHSVRLSNASAAMPDVDCMLLRHR